MEYAVVAEGLSVSYEKLSVLFDLSFKIPKGVMLGLIGPNGAGKSTLLKAALGLTKPFSGKISCAGSFAYVPQRETVDWDFPITAEELVLMGRYGQLGFFSRPKKADYMAAQEALEQVGMGPFAKRQISELSGGQQQRLFIARALVQMADILFLDEPFVGVDLGAEKVIVELLKKQKDLGKTIIIVHHDLDRLESYFDWALLINTYLVGCGPLDEVVTKENLSKTFGKNQILFDEAAGLSVKRRRGIL